MKEMNISDLKSITMKLPEGVLKGENVDVYDTESSQQLKNVTSIVITISPVETRAQATFQLGPGQEIEKTVDLVIEFLETK